MCTAVFRVGRRSSAGLIGPGGAPCHALRGKGDGAPCVDRAYDLAQFTDCWRRHGEGGVEQAVEQADAADEGRVEASGSTMVGAFRGSVVIVDESKVVRPSQLIRSVRPTGEGIST